MAHCKGALKKGALKKRGGKGTSCVSYELWRLAMKKALRRLDPLLWVVLLVCAMLLRASMYAENDVMGEIQFEGKSHVGKISGVWVDGE